jgi:hypothetical protein
LYTAKIKPRPLMAAETPPTIALQSAWESGSPADGGVGEVVGSVVDEFVRVAVVDLIDDEGGVLDVAIGAG